MALNDDISPKEPTSFLSLARELRQKILAQAYHLENDAKL